MTRNTHDIINDHFGVLTAAQIAGGTATSGYVPTSNGDGTSTWATGGGGGGGVIVQDEGTPLATTATTLNFTGAGVTASGSGATKTINVPGSSGVNYLLEPVFIATTGSNITISVALNNGDTLDSVSLTTGDRVLVKDQLNADENGIYIVGPSPARSSDWSVSSSPYGKAVIVLAGGLNHETLWLSQAVTTDVIGTDDIFFDSVTPLAGEGTATITSGNTFVAVSHGVFFTPTAAQITVVPTNSPTNDPGNYWIGTIGSSTFRVNVRSNPGASGATFSWRVWR